MTTDSQVHPFVEFEEVIVSGFCPGVRCVDFKQRLTVALPVYSPKILGPSLEIEPELFDIEMELGDYQTVLPIGSTIERPIYMPVEGMQYILRTI